MSDNAKQIVIGIIIGLIVGLLSGIVATYFKMNERITSLEIKLENYHALSNTEGIQETQPESAKRASAEPEELIEIVKTMQNQYVKASYGELAHQCFNEDDLNKFMQSNANEKIIADLKRNNRFVDILLAIKDLPASKQQVLIQVTESTYKPTWAELGKIDPMGQTDEGQKAEKKISKTIADLVRDLLKLDKKAIEALYTM